jgi:hypothetical protein
METSDGQDAGLVGSEPVDAVETSDGAGLGALSAALESAGELPLDERLALLQQAGETIASALEGLDGL